MALESNQKEGKSNEHHHMDVLKQRILVKEIAVGHSGVCCLRVEESEVGEESKEEDDNDFAQEE